MSGDNLPLGDVDLSNQPGKVRRRRENRRAGRRSALRSSAVHQVKGTPMKTIAALLAALAVAFAPLAHADDPPHPRHGRGLLPRRRPGLPDLPRLLRRDALPGRLILAHHPVRHSDARPSERPTVAGDAVRHRRRPGAFARAAGRVRGCGEVVTPNGRLEKEKETELDAPGPIPAPS